MPTTTPGGGAAKPTTKPDPFTTPDPFGINIPGTTAPNPFDNAGKSSLGNIFSGPSLFSFLGINQTQMRALAIRGAEIILGAGICATGVAVVISGSKEAQEAAKAVIGTVTGGAETAPVKTVTKGAATAAVKTVTKGAETATVK